MARTALVIGGGLMGVTSAWYLAERGFEVTVLERREGPALETSFANGGLLTPSQSDPWNAPGTWLYLLKLWREDSPFGQIFAQPLQAIQVTLTPFDSNRCKVCKYNSSESKSLRKTWGVGGSTPNLTRLRGPNSIGRSTCNLPELS